MTRQEIRERFRQENPDITDRTISDTVLNDWINLGQEEMAAETQFLVEDLAFTTVSTQLSYDLTTLSSKFYNIDDKSSGVFYDNKFLVPSSPAELANSNKRFKENTAGEPKAWYRRQNTITLDKYPESAKELLVPCVLLPNDMTSDSDIPFNGLLYLSPVHYGLVAYLTMKAKGKLDKKEAMSIAQQEYMTYVQKGRNLVTSNRKGAVSNLPRKHYYQPSSGYRSYR